MDETGIGQCRRKRRCRKGAGTLCFSWYMAPRGAMMRVPKELTVLSTQEISGTYRRASRLWAQVVIVTAGSSKGRSCCYFI